MKHEHLETVIYEGRSYSRGYKHSHPSSCEAHTHAHAWTGHSKSKVVHYVMGEDVVPVTKIVKTVVGVSL